MKERSPKVFKETLKEKKEAGKEKTKSGTKSPPQSNTGK